MKLLITALLLASSVFAQSTLDYRHVVASGVQDFSPSTFILPTSGSDVTGGACTNPHALTTYVLKLLKCEAGTWQAVTSAGTITTVFGRSTSAIVAVSGDYTAAQVTNAVDQTGSYANPAWITSLAWSKVSGTAPSFLTANQTVSVSGDATGSGATAITLNVGKLNGVSLSGLATGLLKNTTGTGVPSAATASDVFALFTGCSGIQYPGFDGACHTPAGGGGTGTVTHTAGALALGAVMVGNNGADAKTSSVTVDVNGNVVAAGFIGSGTTPSAIILPAGTGNIAALPASSAGFATPGTGGTPYLIKLPPTINAGIPILAAPASGDGVNESVMTVSTTVPFSMIMQGDVTATRPGGTASSFLGGDGSFTLSTDNIGTSVLTFFQGVPGASNDGKWHMSTFQLAGGGWQDRLSIDPTTGAVNIPSGNLSSTAVNKLTITPPATSSTLTVANGKTLTASNTLTLTGTDGSAAAFGAGGTVAYQGGALGTPSSVTLTNATGLPTAGLLANAVNSSKLAVANTYRVCDLPVGDTSGSAITNSQLGPQSRMCFIPAAATIVEMDVNADAGTPNVIVGRNHAGTITNIVSGALATAASGGIACSAVGATTSINTVTTCAATLQNTALAAGDYLELVSGTAGGTAKFFAVHVVYTVN